MQGVAAKNDASYDLSRARAWSQIDRGGLNGDDGRRVGQNRSLSLRPHGRTRMTVFPGRRSVELKAATASSGGATVPMFVRRRPSRSRWTLSLSWDGSDSTT